MNKMPSANFIVGLPNLRINTISISEGEIILQAEITKRTAVCPICGKISKNRLKTIKRQMYGRAGLELLKRKVILSLSG